MMRGLTTKKAFASGSLIMIALLLTVVRLVEVYNFSSSSSMMSLNQTMNAKKMNSISHEEAVRNNATTAPSTVWACEWKPPPTNLTECYELFTRHLLRGRHRWYFLGDSTMRYFFSELKNAVVSSAIDGNNPMPPRQANEVKRATKCGAVEYFGFERAAEWISPNRSLGEGPSTIHGYPFCSEAHTVNIRMEIDYNNTDVVTKTAAPFEFPSLAKFQFELLCVEFSLDVELPTVLTRTTQETVAMYLERENRQHLHDTVCVVSTGIHDTRLLTNGMSPEMYVNNTERYLRLIHPHCGVLIWLGIAAVSESNRFPQKNEDLVLMNDGVNRALDRYNNKQKMMMTLKDQSFRPILRIDVWNKALRTPHRDHVHLSIPDYYQPLASLAAQFLQPVLPP